MLRNVMIFLMFVICTFIGYFYAEKMNLSVDDHKIISDFFKTLGSSGVTGQDKIFKVALDNIDVNYKEARKFEKENIKLYRTLGLSIGAMLAIFFI